MLKRIIAMIAVVGGSAATPAAADETFVTVRNLTPEIALELAQATLGACREAGYQVAVAVVDRFGTTQVMLRDRFAGPHTPGTAHGKAWSAVSFRTDTLQLADLSQAGQPQSGVRFVPGAIMIGGGVPVESGGSIVAGVGVSGGPGGEADDACARAGIDSIVGKLEF